jgi:RHS repeat-associated protein
MLASKFMDIVLGIDRHIEMVPTPAGALVPVPFPAPFMGVIFDPAQLASTLMHDCPGLGMVFAALDPVGTIVNMVADKIEGVGGGPVLINGMPATNTMSQMTTRYGIPHIVTPPGVTFLTAGKPLMEGDAKFNFGSSSVWLNGRRAVRTLVDLVSSCSEPIRLPTSINTPMPLGRPVLTGGFPTPDLQAMISGALRHAATSALKNFIGPRLQNLLGRLPPSRLRNLLSAYVCFATGHPVDVATGRMFTTAIDWELPGPMPLVFERQYCSVVSDRDGALGFGWNHALDQSVWLERGCVVYRAGDGREIVADTFGFHGRVMRAGDETFEPCSRLTFRCQQDGWEIENADGVSHEFRRVRGDRIRDRWRLTKIRARDGHELSLEYDELGTLAYVQDSARRIIRFEHDRAGRLVRVNLPHPSEDGWLTYVKYSYSSDGNLVAVEDALGHTTRYEYSGHLMVRETDRNGLSFYFGYDGLDSRAWCVRTWGDGGILDHTIDYDKAGLRTFVTNSLGHTTVYRMNEALAVIEVTDPHGAKTQYEYNEVLWKIREVDAHGLETRWLHDERGNCTRVINPDGTERTTDYGQFDRPSQVVTETGATWRWEYDRVGRMTRQVDPEGRLLEVKYKQGLVETIRYPGGATEQFEYDNHKNIVAITDPNGHVTRHKWDRLGRVVEITNAVGGVTRLRYNALGDVLAVESPTGVRARYSYDAERNVTSFVDETQSIRLKYGGYHKVVEQEEGGTTLRYVFDTEENLIALVNGSDERYTFKLDACGRVQEEVSFDGQKRTYLREKGGWLTKTILPGGRTNEYTYDKVGRLTQIKYHDGGFTRFSYGSRGLVSVENAWAKIEIKRDLLGRIVTERVNGREVSSRYGPDGGRTEMRTSLGARVAAVRDPMGQVRELVLGRPDGFKGAYVQFERDALGLERVRRFSNGVDVEWARDLAGRPTARLTGHPDKARPDARTYQWRGEDQIAAVVDRATGPRLFDHDRRGRLIREKRPDRIIERALDAVGNVYRTESGRDRRYGAGGRLLEADGCRYEYDLDGNVVAKLEPDGRRWTYRWNGAGMMVEVVRPDSTRVTFEYDGFARRIAKRVLGVDGAVACETRFVWDGHVIVHELDSDSGLTTWHWEPETFTPVAKESLGQRWSIASDHLGTPTEMYDEAGRLAWKMQLDLFGVPSFDAGAAGDCPWRWPGQHADEETGLYYNRFRYYEPNAGQYLSKDPIGILGGTSLYGYTGDPCIYIDPLGLANFCATTKRWRDKAGRFTKRPTDPADLVNNGRIDYPSLMQWGRGLPDWNPAKPGNQWAPSSKFPTGGFSYDLRDPGGTRYKLWGHGANPAAPPGSNAAAGPTTTISRSGGGAGHTLTTSGTWAPTGVSPPNDVHIPLDNSPF